MPIAPETSLEIEELLRRVGQGLRHLRVTELAEKAPLDLVSSLDFWAEREVSSFLAQHFPGDTLLSEESSSAVEYADRIWVLDPLDGTVNRASHVPFFGISLALLEHGSPSAGYVYDPVHEELFVAHAGRGATMNGVRLSATTDDVLGLALTSKLLRQLVRRAPEQLYELLAHQGRLRNFGAQALQLCYVAAGRLSAAASLETSLWDNAAGALIVREAGGLYTDLSGNDPFPLTPGAPALKGGRAACLAANPKAHARLLPFLRRAV